MSKSKTFLSRLGEASKSGTFSSTVNGLSFIVSDADGNEISHKVINMISTSTVEEAINDLHEAIQYLQQHKDKIVDMSEPTL